MFSVLVLQALYTLSDEQTEYQLRDRLSSMRFAGLALHDAVPDAKTIWLYREQLMRAGALARLFARFDAMLAERGFLAMGGQVVEVRRPRLTREEKAALRDGGTPEGWSKARARQIDRDGRWTIKRGRKAPPPEGGVQRQAAEIAVPMFGYKNHLGIDRGHGFIRRFTVTHAVRHDGSQLGAVLDANNTASGVWADTAYRSKANVELLDRHGLVPEFQRAKPRGRPRPAHISRGNATRAQVRSLVEHVFATEKRRMGLVVRSIGLARATARITLATSPTTCVVWSGSRGEVRPLEAVGTARTNLTTRSSPELRHAVAPAGIPATPTALSSPSQ